MHVEIINQSSCFSEQPTLKSKNAPAAHCSDSLDVPLANRGNQTEIFIAGLFVYKTAMTDALSNKALRQRTT